MDVETSQMCHAKFLFSKLLIPYKHNETQEINLNSTWKKPFTWQRELNTGCIEGFDMMYDVWYSKAAFIHGSSTKLLFVLFNVGCETSMTEISLLYKSV